MEYDVCFRNFVKFTPRPEKRFRKVEFIKLNTRKSEKNSCIYRVFQTYRTTPVLVDSWRYVFEIENPNTKKC